MEDKHPQLCGIADDDHDVEIRKRKLTMIEGITTKILRRLSIYRY